MHKGRPCPCECGRAGMLLDAAVSLRPTSIRVPHRLRPVWQVFDDGYISNLAAFAACQQVAHIVHGRVALAVDFPRRRFACLGWSIVAA
jgi:hypothetical protein